MNHEDHVGLIKPGIPGRAGVWADMGAGRGAFTLALRDVVGPDAEIWAVDRDRNVLLDLAGTFDRDFADSIFRTITGDYTDPIDLPELDGIIAANTLHYVDRRDQIDLLRLWRSYLKSSGRLIIVEYGTDHGNRWVPHPFSFSTLQQMGQDAGYDTVEQLASRSSRFLGSIYSAVLVSGSGIVS